GEGFVGGGEEAQRPTLLRAEEAAGAAKAIARNAGVVNRARKVTITQNVPALLIEGRDIACQAIAVPSNFIPPPASNTTVCYSPAARPELLNPHWRGSMLNSLEAWFLYFSNNARDDRGLDFARPDCLTRDEILMIKDSIATFQLGEQSEGKGLLKSAEAFSIAHDLPLLVPITRMFIREEQNHSILLGRFMALHGIKLKKRNWTDWVFRRLRK